MLVEHGVAAEDFRMVSKNSNNLEQLILTLNEGRYDNDNFTATPLSINQRAGARFDE